jgi:hypothetical protein
MQKEKIKLWKAFNLPMQLEGSFVLIVEKIAANVEIQS